MDVRFRPDLLQLIDDIVVIRMIGHVADHAQRDRIVRIAHIHEHHVHAGVRLVRIVNQNILFRNAALAYADHHQLHSDLRDAA